ncbi:MAG: hypothetical protein ACQEU4_12265 [Bacillota bacterium]
MKKSIIWYIILGSLIFFLLTPWIVTQLFKFPAKVPVDANDVWLGFLGSYLGGIIGGVLSGTLTLLGVRVSIKSSEKVNKEQMEAQLKLFKEQLENSNHQLEQQLNHDREIFNKQIEHEKNMELKRQKTTYPDKIRKIDIILEELEEFNKDFSTVNDQQKTSKIVKLRNNLKTKLLDLGSQVDEGVYQPMVYLLRDLDNYIRENNINLNENGGHSYHKLTMLDYSSILNTYEFSRQACKTYKLKYRYLLSE